MSKCLNCGSFVDGDVCDSRCANELHERIEHEQAPHGRCGCCGDPAPELDVDGWTTDKRGDRECKPCRDENGGDMPNMYPLGAGNY